MRISSHQDLADLIVDLLGETEVTAPELHLRLNQRGVAFSRLAFDGLLASLEVSGIVRGRYATPTDYDESAMRVYRSAAAAVDVASNRRAAA